MSVDFHKYFVLSFITVVFIVNGFSFSQKSEAPIFRAVISSSMFQNTKSEDIEAATKILASEMIKEDKVNAKYEITVCKTKEELQDNLKSTFDLLYISPTDFLDLKKKSDLEPLVIAEVDNDYGDVYYLITNKSENIKSIRDLKNGTINILSRSNNQPPTLWLDKILRDNKLPIKEKFFDQITYDYKTNNVLLPVFFKKSSAAIVTKSAFDLICELNPKVKQETEIILKSKPIVRSLFCADGKRKDQERKDFLYDYLKRVHKSNYGKQVLSLYMVTRLLPYKQEYLNNILELYK